MRAEKISGVSAWIVGTVTAPVKRYTGYQKLKREIWEEPFDNPEVRARLSNPKGGIALEVQFQDCTFLSLKYSFPISKISHDPEFFRLIVTHP
jgi:hypothetical protein